MKSKFVLTEEESKRILSLHKRQINEELSEYTAEQKQKYGEKSLSFIDNGVFTVPSTFTAENADAYTLASELKIFKGSKFKPSGTKGVFTYTGNYQFADDLSGQNEMGNFTGTILYFCKQSKLKVKGQPYGYIVENYPVIYRAFKALCGLSSGAKSATKPEQVKQQLTPEEMRLKAKACGYSSWDEYKNSGWKCKTKQGASDTGTTPPIGGGGSTSETYPFDYDTILKAIQDKFPGEGIINPFGQGGESQQPAVTVTDKMYADLG